MASIEELSELCRLVRYNIITETTHAQSGHPTSSLSAVELLTTLFFGGFFHQDTDIPHSYANDRIIFSKGHASPLLYALYQAAGVISREQLMSYREFPSRLEGHPTPLFPFHEVETGSLGQGLSIGLGMALGTRLRFKKKDVEQGRIPHIFVLMGDSEFAEGQIYEAMQIASTYRVGNLIGLLDVNRLGQRGETMLGWDIDAYEHRIQSFGWRTIIIEDGHDLHQITKALSIGLSEHQSHQIPLMIIAKTIKGKGISVLENQENWHGKTLPKELLPKVLEELGYVDPNLKGTIAMSTVTATKLAVDPHRNLDDKDIVLPQRYTASEEIATREAYGDALVSIGKHDPEVLVLDAEVSNSTFADAFKQVFPERFFEMYIAEQNMVSVALGLSKMGFKPYVSSFAAFLNRAADQIRMSQYSYANVVFCGSHAGVSIGQDGSSQMGLEDISLFKDVLQSYVVYPSDAISTFKLMHEIHKTQGIRYIRTTRSKTPIIYKDSDVFRIGNIRILRSSENDSAIVFAAGITTHEALKAYQICEKENIHIAVVDLYSIKPIDAQIVQKLAKEKKNVVVVEDHFPNGGIGETVLNALSSGGKVEENLSYAHLCVKKIPHSGSPEQLLAYEEINAQSIVNAIKRLVNK